MHTTIAAAAVCLLGLASNCLGQQPLNYEIPRTPFPQQHFKSSNATAPVLQINKTGEPLANGLLFFQPQLRTPALIMNDDGELIWCGPAEPVTNDQAQRLFGKKVLTRWVGALAAGFGYGAVKILDTTYNQIYDICPNFGLYAPNLPVPPQCQADTHELYISDRNTLVVTAWNVTQTDLTSVGGTSNGWVVDGQFYDIDIETGQTIFGWKSLQHVPVNQSLLPLNGSGTIPQKAYNYFHINSVQPLPGGKYLANGRYTSTMYLINRHGKIEWEFNGFNGGDFGPLPPGGEFEFQHDPRIRQMTGNTVIITLFNNDNSEVRFGQNQSTGIEYELNTATWSATLLRQLVDPNQPYYSIAQGSYQPLKNGNTLLGYGQEPVFKEYGPVSNTDVRMTIIFSNVTSNGTYRVYREPWHATPYYPPGLYVDGQAGVAYTSWNGATDVTRYKLYGGASNSSLHKIATFPKTGFETNYTLPSSDSNLGYFQVVAYDCRKKLGESAVVTPSTPSSPTSY